MQWQKKPFTGSPLQKLQKLLLVTFNPKIQDVFIILCSMLASRVRPRARCPYSSAGWPRGTIRSNPLPRGKPQWRRGNTHAFSRGCGIHPCPTEVCNTSAHVRTSPVRELWKLLKKLWNSFPETHAMLNTKTNLHCHGMCHCHSGAWLNHFFQRNKRGEREESTKLLFPLFSPVFLIDSLDTHFPVLSCLL